MLYNCNKEQEFHSLSDRGKQYVTPRINITAIETVHLMAGSDPKATIEDIHYGENLTDEIDDQ